jgi:glutaredoxin
MPTICPKCRTLRPADTTAPDWQCPACGVVYAKAGSDAAAVQQAHTARAKVAAYGKPGEGLLGNVPWAKLLIGLVMVCSAWLVFHNFGATVSDASGSSRAGRIGANPSNEQLAQLAASAQAGDVVMYSATWCPNCSAAKSWMGQYGFQAQVCEIDKDSSCLSALKSLDPQGGVPYLIVKGHHMKDGFDSDEFVAALAK